jgi:hypothetical protein
MWMSGAFHFSASSTACFTPWVLTLRPTSSEGLKETRPAQLTMPATLPVSSSAWACSRPMSGSVMSPSSTSHFLRMNSRAPASPYVSRSGWKGSLVATLSKKRRSAEAALPLRTRT